MSQTLPEQNREALSLLMVSHNQKRMWYAYQLTAPAGEYNLPFSARIAGPVDLAALQRALEALVARHAILRTTYTLIEGELFQEAHAALPFHLAMVDATTWQEEELKQRVTEVARRPFDLAHDIPLRAGIFTITPQSHILLLVIHHIAVDTVAIGYLLHDLAKLYAAESSQLPHPAPPTGQPYREFVRWQATLLAGKKGEQLRTYWHRQLSGKLPLLQLPTDQPYPVVQSYYGHSQGFALDAVLIDKLRSIGGEETTLYTILLAAFYILLARYSGQEDILIGSPISNRTRDEFMHSVGDFSDVVVMRADLTSNPTVADLLSQVQRTVRNGLFYADYPFDLLLGELDYQRDPRRSPVYQVLFNMPQANSPTLNKFAPFLIPFPGPVEVEFGGLHLQPFYLYVLEAPVELTLDIWEPDGYYGVFKYNRELFAAQTIERMIEHYQTLLAAMAADPSQRIADLPLTTNPGAMTDWLLPPTRTVWCETALIHLDRIEAALLAHPQVADCWVTVRKATTSQPELNAYLVLNEPVSSAVLQTQVQSALPPGFHSINLLPISTLPLTPAGRVDEATLATLLR